MRSFSLFKSSYLFIALLALSISTLAGQAFEHEEEGKLLKKSDTYSETKKGLALILKYDKGQEAFVGTLENKSREPIEKTRVEVHLSNGKELGPSTSKTLQPGERSKIRINAKGQLFDTWSTHAEYGTGEHGHHEDKDVHRAGHEEHGDSHNESHEKHSATHEEDGSHKNGVHDQHNEGAMHHGHGDHEGHQD